MPQPSEPNWYLVLLRGVNVGGKNRVPMAELRARLEDDGFNDVATLLVSGNVLLTASDPADAVRRRVEGVLGGFDLEDAPVRALALERDAVRRVVEEKPEGFGERPDTFHSDAVFLMDLDVDEAMTAFDPREGVDRVWPGPGVVYSERVTALRTRSRLSRIIGSPLYRSMTIRSWSTTTKLWNALREG